MACSQFKKTSGCEATKLFKATRQTGKGKPNTQALRTSHKCSLQLDWFAVLIGKLTGSSGCCRLTAFLMRKQKKSASSSLESYLGGSCAFKGIIMITRPYHHQFKHFHMSHWKLKYKVEYRRNIWIEEAKCGCLQNSGKWWCLNTSWQHSAAVTTELLLSLESPSLQVGNLEIPDTSKQTFQELSWNDILSCMTLFSCLWKYPHRWPLLATSELSSYFIVLQTTPRLRKRGRILKTVKQSLRKRVKSSRKIFLEFSFFPLSQSRSFKSILTSVATSLFCKWGSNFGAAAPTSKNLIRISSTC